MLQRGWLSCWVGLACLSASVSVSAQLDEAPDQRAREAFDRGVALYERGQFSDAEAQFHEADVLWLAIAA